MKDFDRFLASAREHAAHIHRTADRLLAEGKIGLGARDALAGAARDPLRDAYPAGRG